MLFHEDVRPLLAARAATDPVAARLLEMFTNAEESLRQHKLEGNSTVSLRVDGDENCREMN